MKMIRRSMAIIFIIKKVFDVNVTKHSSERREDHTNDVDSHSDPVEPTEPSGEDDQENHPACEPEPEKDGTEANDQTSRDSEERAVPDSLEELTHSGTSS